MSLQLEKKTVDFDGRPYVLTCNMAALDALQALHGDSMEQIFKTPAKFVSRELFVIMLNRARALCGEEPVPDEQIAEEYTYAMLDEMDIFGMFLRSMDASVAKKAQDAEGEKKN